MSEVKPIIKIKELSRAFLDDVSNGERLYLAALTMYLIAGYSDTTMFDRWMLVVRIFKYFPLLILCVKFVFFDRYKVKEFFLKVLILAVGSIVMLKAGSEASRAMYCCYFLATAKNVRFTRILECFVLVNIAYIAVTLFACNFDMVVNLIYKTFRSDRYVWRQSFGFIFPTDAAAHFLYLTMSAFYLFRERIKWYICMLAILIQVPIFVLSNTRATMYGMIIFCLGFMLLKVNEDLKKRELKGRYTDRSVSVLFRWFMLLCAVFMTTLTLLFDYENKFMVQLNQWLSTRLILGKEGIENYGISLLGNNVDFIGFGGTLKKTPGYNFVDCSYLYSAIKYGMLYLLIIVAAYIFACYRYKRDVFFILCVMVISIHSMVEHHLMDLTYAIFLLAATSVSDQGGGKCGTVADPVV